MSVLRRHRVWDTQVAPVEMSLIRTCIDDRRCISRNFLRWQAATLLCRLVKWLRGALKSTGSQSGPSLLLDQSSHRATSRFEDGGCE